MQPHHTFDWVLPEQLGAGVNPSVSGSAAAELRKIAALPLPVGIADSVADKIAQKTCTEWQCAKNRLQGRRSWLPRWPEGLEPPHLRLAVTGSDREPGGALTPEPLPG